MKTNWRFLVGGYIGLAIGLLLGGFLFGMVTHENSHVIACLVFGLRIHSYSLIQVVYEESINPLVNITVRLAGGAGEALLSLLFLWYTTTLEQRALKQMVFKGIFQSKQSPILGIILGFELAFLTIAFHGVMNGIWEGFFFENYSQLYNNIVLTGIILLFSASISFIIIRRRYLRLTGQGMHKLSSTSSC